MATSIETAAELENGETHADAEDTVATQAQDVTLSDASTSLAAEGIHDNPKVTADAGVVQGTDAADAAPNGQDRPRGRAEQTIAHVRQLRAEMEKLRSHPDLDPIRKARALGQLAHEALQAIDLDSRLAAATQRSPSVERTREREQTIAHVQRVLAKEMKKVRAHPDLDPLQKAQAAARLAREARRAIELKRRLVDPVSDFRARLEEILEQMRREPIPEDPREILARIQLMSRTSAS